MNKSQMENKQYLSKSRFLLGVECATKLYYAGRPDVYANLSSGDEFMLALADGGYQVGELAKHYFPGGETVGRDFDGDAAKRTAELIEGGDVTIYEAAFRAEDFFIFADIVTVSGDVLNIYEVKAKSIDPTLDSFLNAKGDKIRSEWQQYLLDVAYQKFVVGLAFPTKTICAHLVLADKTSRCPTDGLNQKFRVKRDSSGRMRIRTAEITAEDLSEQILAIKNVDPICDMLIEGIVASNDLGQSIGEHAGHLAVINAGDERVTPIASLKCRRCEFRATESELAEGKISGFRQCWSELFGWEDEHFARESVLDIWDFRGKDKLIKQMRVNLTDIHDSDLNLKNDEKPGISRTTRQLIQIEKARSGDMTPFIDADGLRREFAKWQFPLHFIDFETSMPAIPFNAGRHPYEGIAFQFSHHIIHENGTVEHHGEFISADPGVFPNYDFVRELRNQLNNDDGTIFRYAAHENSFLNHIYKQLAEDRDFPDRLELMTFIQKISKSTSDSVEQWEGPRNMVDLLEMVKRYYYHPLTRGSNSIKSVLPGILASSSFLQEKYSKPIYGSPDGIKSLNFVDWSWVQFQDGTVQDPYSLLPKLFADLTVEDLESKISDSDELKSGGAALTAYAKLQFEDMSDTERKAIIEGLLKYCELDTLAMVMIYEGWREMIK